MAPSILLIGGGWHVPDSYTKLVTALKSDGFDVHVPLHPPMNGSRLPKDLYTDTQNTRSIAEKLINEGKELVVIMHSYGGQVGTNALYGLGLKERKENVSTGGVAHLIYLTAAANSEGKAQMDLPLNTPRAAWRDGPVTYVFTTRDMTIPFDYQKWYVEEMRREGVAVQTATVETGRAPHLTATHEAVELVKKVVNGEEMGDDSSIVQEVASTNVVTDAIKHVGNPA